MRWRQTFIVAALTICACAAFQGVAQACPMCSQSIAEDDHLPRAYMYSILFMMSMPAIVFSGICVCIYRVVKNRPHLTPQEAIQERDDHEPVLAAPELSVGT